MSHRGQERSLNAGPYPGVHPPGNLINCPPYQWPVENRPNSNAEADSTGKWNFEIEKKSSGDGVVKEEVQRLLVSDALLIRPGPNP